MTVKLPQWLRPSKIILEIYEFISPKGWGGRLQISCNNDSRMFTIEKVVEDLFSPTR